MFCRARSGKITGENRRSRHGRQENEQEEEKNGVRTTRRKEEEEEEGEEEGGEGNRSRTKEDDGPMRNSKIEYTLWTSSCVTLKLKHGVSELSE